MPPSAPIPGSAAAGWRAPAGSLLCPLLRPLLGLILMIMVWWLAVHGLGHGSVMAMRFSPEATFRAIGRLAVGADIWRQAGASLLRVISGLMIALVMGVPVGLLVGVSRGFDRLTSVSFQFLRMISPLSWMPIAIMVLGIGDAPIIFLLAFSALWPIILNVAAGVRAIDPLWLTLADSLGANGQERMRHVIIPAIAGHLLTGIRLAIGLIWVVLVPAEMLGVNSGLGYLILDARDRISYDEMMACVVLIGLLGFLLDGLIRYAHHRWRDD